MTKNITTQSASLSLEMITKQINRAERDLIEQRSTLDDDDGMAVLFTGNHHDAIPRHLIVNQQLSANEKLTWQVIRLSISDPNRPGSTPRRNDIAAMVNCSAPTVTANRTMLRIRGWLTYCRTVRSSGRFVGDIFLLNDEPMSLQSIIEVDHRFVEFLEEQVSSKNQRLRLAAAEVLQLVRNLTTAEPPTELVQLGSRLERAISDPIHQSKIFAPVKTENHDDFSADVAKSSTYDNQSNNFATVKIDQNLDRSKNFAPVDKKNFYSLGSSSSFNNNKYISIAHTPANGNPDAENADRVAAESLANFLEIQRHGKYGMDHPDDDKRWLERYLPWLSRPEFEPYVMYLVAGRHNLFPVIWQKIKPLPKHSQEIVIYQLLGHVAAWRHGWRSAIRDPIAYLHRLVELQQANKLYPDEWSLALKRCVDHGDALSFEDSPDLREWKRRQEANVGQ